MLHTITHPYAMGCLLLVSLMSSSLPAFANLSAAEQQTLSFMREEEKLARDVYQVLYKTYPLRPFANIAAAEQQHMDALKHLVQRYQMLDPVKTEQVGQFTDNSLTQLYQALIQRGQSSEIAALQVGALIEETDIQDLRKALANTQTPSLKQTYQNLLEGSYRHLQAFVRQLKQRQQAYQAQVLTPAELKQILQMDSGRGHGRGQAWREQ